MAEEQRSVKLVLNQQQLELVDATLARIGAQDRAGVVRTALKEFFARHGANRPESKP